VARGRCRTGRPRAGSRRIPRPPGRRQGRRRRGKGGPHPGPSASPRAAAGYPAPCRPRRASRNRRGRWWQDAPGRRSRRPVHGHRTPGLDRRVSSQRSDTAGCLPRPSGLRPATGRLARTPGGRWLRATLRAAAGADRFPGRTDRSSWPCPIRRRSTLQRPPSGRPERARRRRSGPLGRLRWAVGGRGAAGPSRAPTRAASCRSSPSPDSGSRCRCRCARWRPCASRPRCAGPAREVARRPEWRRATRRARTASGSRRGEACESPPDGAEARTARL
jgi:hypothetical protein